VIDVPGRAGERCEAVVADPVSIDEEFKRDEQRIACESGERGVGGIAVAGGAERKNLPEALLRGGEEVGEGVGVGSKISDATERRQRSNMQQESRGTFKGHESILTEWMQKRKSAVPEEIRNARASLLF
jgi:hypothetical protein